MFGKIDKDHDLARYGKIEKDSILLCLATLVILVSLALSRQINLLYLSKKIILINHASN
jgi:hypothetical protein